LKIYGLNILFIIIVAVACNVAPQDAQTPKSESNVVNNPSLNYDQKFSFNTSVETTTEMNGIFTTMLTRTGSNFPASQEVIIRLGGTAENADLSGVLVNGAPATFISATQFTATFPQGTNSLPISLVTFDDTIFEQQEFFKISLEPNGRDYGIVGNTEFSIIINDNDPYPQAYFATSTYTNDEGLFVDVQVSISNFSENDISVPIVYEALGSTVTSNDSDFINQTLIFNQTNGLGLVQTIRVNLTADAFNELDEILKLKIAAPLQAIIGPIPETNITITDPGVAPSYSLQAASYSFNEAGGGNTFALTLQMTGTVENEIIVPLSSTIVTGTVIEGVDYTKTKSSFVIPAGSTNATDTITFTATDDLTWEDDEVFQVSIPNTTYANAAGNTSATVTLVEVGESIPSIGVIATNYETTEGNTFQLPIELNYRSAYPITVNYTVDNVLSDSATPISDHTLSASGTFIIPAGTKIYNHSIYIVPDGIYDQGEKIRITISVIDPTQATVSSPNAEININEAGGLATVTFSNSLSSGLEGVSSQINFTLSQNSQNNQTFEIVVDEIGATSADFDDLADVNASCSIVKNSPSVHRYTITINAGQTNCPIEIPIIATDDTLDEPTEQLRLRILQPQNLNIGAIGSHNFDILDNDVASTASITSGAATVVEGASQTFTVALDKLSGFDIYVSVEIDGANTATLTDDYTLSSQTIFIPKGILSQTFTLDSIADNNFEGVNENVTLNIASGASYTIGAPASASITINETESAPELTIRGAASEPFSENDIVNIIFELDKPTVENILVQFDRSVAPGVFCDNTAPPALGTTPNRCAILNEDLPELDAHVGYVIIPAGTTQAVLSFRILADNLFELNRDEAFEVSLPAIAAANTYTVDVNGDPAVLTPHPSITVGASDRKLITISDVDTPSIARFIGDKFVTKNEGEATTLTIPFFLSTPSAENVTFKVMIKQSDNPSVYKADANDFTDGPNFYDTSEPTATENVGLQVNPGAPVSALEYSGSGDIIYQRQVTILAGQTSYNLDIDINNTDTIYEDIEQFFVVIEEDDIAPSAYYPYSVSSAHDKFIVNILEKDSAPTVSFTLLPFDQPEGLDSTNPANTGLMNDIRTAPPGPGAGNAGDLPKNDLAFTFGASLGHQHEDMTFTLSFSGSAKYISNYTTSDEFMVEDYWIYLTPSAPGDFTTFTSSGTNIDYTIPAGYSDAATLSATATAQVFEDFQFEEDETIVATLSNTQFISLGSTPEHTSIVQNDDKPPVLAAQDSEGQLFPLTLTESTTQRIIDIFPTDDVGFFSGGTITEVPFTLEVEIETSRRQVANVSVLTAVFLNLDSSNAFTTTMEISPTITGDFRRYRAINLNFDPEDGKTSIDAGFTRVINFTVPEPKIALSKGNDTIGSGFKGHSCTLYRGQVTCFGNNEFGQLGKENTTSFGGGLTDDISTQSRVIDFGTNIYGVEHYITDIAVGKNHTCVLTSTNQVKCFGENQYGQLGYGNTSNYGGSTGSMGSSLPNVNVGSAEIVDSIIAMNDSTCALIGGDTIKCWGKNDMGQAGIGDITDTDIGSSSSEMSTNLGSVGFSGIEMDMLSGGGEHACVRITGTNELKCWGNNLHGQLGLNNTPVFFPSDTNHGDEAGEPSLSANISTASVLTSIVLGARHTCVSFVAGTFNTRCFGDNRGGQLGMGRTHSLAEDLNPAYTSTPSDILYYLGYSMIGNGFEILETSGDSADPNNVPVVAITNNQYAQVREPASSIAAGDSHTCGVYDFYFNETGVRTAGKNIKCWGSNYHYDNSGSHVETGVLNNIGTNVGFSGSWNGTTLQPYVSFPATNSFYFRQDLKFIGDGSFDSGGAENNGYEYLENAFGANHEYGWVSGFFSTGTLNFELNYLYSMSRESLNIWANNFDEIKVYSGSDHVCAYLIDTTKNEFDEINDRYKFMCWGENGSGQLGTPNTSCSKRGISTGSCTNTPLTMKALNYNY